MLPPLQQMQMLSSPVLLGVTSHLVCLSSSSFFAVASSFRLAVFTTFRRKMIPFQQEAKCPYFKDFAHFLPFAGQGSRAKRPFFPQMKHVFFLTGPRPFLLCFRWHLHSLQTSYTAFVFWPLPKLLLFRESHPKGFSLFPTISFSATYRLTTLLIGLANVLLTLHLNYSVLPVGEDALGIYPPVPIHLAPFA